MIWPEKSMKASLVINVLPVIIRVNDAVNAKHFAGILWTAGGNVIVWHLVPTKQNVPIVWHRGSMDIVESICKTDIKWVLFLEYNCVWLIIE